MNQKDFVKHLEKSNSEKIMISVCWYLDEHKRVIIDYEGMREEFENKLKELRDISNINTLKGGLK